MYRPAVLRQLFRGRVWSATPSLIVHDDEQLTVLWMPPRLTFAIGDGLFQEWTYKLRVLRRGQIRLLCHGEPSPCSCSSTTMRASAAGT